MKSIKYISCLFLLLNLVHAETILPREVEEDTTEEVSLSRKERREQERQAEEERNRPSIFKRAGNWFKNAWNKVRGSVKKAGHSIKQNTKNLFSKSKKHVNAQWATTNQHHKNNTRDQRQAQKDEREIHHNSIVAQALVDELQDSEHYPLKKLAQKYHRSAQKGKRDAINLRNDLEFAQRHAAQEANRVKQINAENRETIEMHKDAFMNLQATIDHENKQTLSEIREEQKSLKKKQKQERKDRERAERQERQNQIIGLEERKNS